MSDTTDDETVLVPTRAYSRNDHVYHTERCRVVEQHGRDNYREVTEITRIGDWRECDWCAGTDSELSRDMSECPRCGEAVALLPRHLRHSCSGESDA